MADVSGKIHSVTEGGITADHIEVPLPPAIVAATHSGKEQNTLKQSIIPFACWRTHDMRFKFESSFVLPEVATEIGDLKILIDHHTVKDELGTERRPALSVFGHADPTGNDDFNKALSGRRAQAIYALLTRKTDLWEELFSQCLGGDKWGREALGTMLDTVSRAAQPEGIDEPRQKGGKPGDGQAASEEDSAAAKERDTKIEKLEFDAEQREELFKSYMDAICVVEVFRLEAADERRLQSQGVEVAGRLAGLLDQEFGTEKDFLQAVANVAAGRELLHDKEALLREAKKKKPFVVRPKDFLAGGKDKGGKADYQGCGEFNPIFLQSKEDIDRFNSVPVSSPERSILNAVRDAANEPDRRVLIFLFRPGLRISPDVWPCPRVKEGTEGCRKRFWSDGDKRRNTRLPDKPRTFDETKDTFACRFYDRLSNNSPCEVIPRLYQIRLFNELAEPLPFAPCMVIDAKQDSGLADNRPKGGHSLRLLRANKDAFITLRELKIPTTITVKWSPAKLGDDEKSPPPSASDSFTFELNLFVDIPEDNSEKVSFQRLHNLGYTFGPRSEDDIRAFQRHHQARFKDKQLGINGILDKQTREAIQQVHDECDPAVRDET